MNSVEKILEGIKLIKEGCSEIPAGSYYCGESTCPFWHYCREITIPPEYWNIHTPHD